MGSRVMVVCVLSSGAIELSNLIKLRVRITPGVLLIGVQERTSNNLLLFLEILNKLRLVQGRTRTARVNLLAAL